MAENALTINVPDMNCEHCAATITKALNQVEGVKDIRTDPGAKTVVVSCETGVNNSAITEAITEAGFNPELKNTSD